MKFIEFKKIPRLNREMVLTEKLDGSNAQIYIVNKEDIVTDLTGDFAGYKEYTINENDTQYMFACSRSKYITPGKKTDNYGFAQWVKDNGEELFKLGKGHHFGEWYGKGINRGYGLENKRFALFNVHKWIKKYDGKGTKFMLEKGQDYLPDCCNVVPILYIGLFNTKVIQDYLEMLKISGSVAVPNFKNPEGLVVYHLASGQNFKVTIEGDEKPKGLINEKM